METRYEIYYVSEQFDNGRQFFKLTLMLAQSTPVLLPGKSHGQRSLVGYSPWGRKESDTTERLHGSWLVTETFSLCRTSECGLICLH